MAPERVSKQELSWNLQQEAQWQPFRHAIMNLGINSHRNHLIYYVFLDTRLFTLIIAILKSLLLLS